MASRKSANGAAKINGTSGARRTTAPGGAADTSDNFKIHLLDVGREKYGDCVLCQFGSVSVLIDGSHRGDDRLILRQLKRLLGQQTLPLRVTLLIVTHPHDDHIGCLPSLVAADQLRSEWALVADPRFRWGDSEEAEDFFAGLDYRTRALTEALMEEDRSDLSDSELGLFIDNAGTLVNRYRTMLRQLEGRGTTVVRNGTDAPDDLRSALRERGVDLKVIGPTREHLEESFRLLHAGAADSLDLVRDAFGADTAMDVVSSYRNLMADDEAAERHNPNKGAINLQSIVTRFEYREEKFLFGGDMQFSAPEVESEILTGAVDALLSEISDEAPYSFAKISHHGSYNAMDKTVLDAFGETRLYGICGGLQGASHPHRDVLRLLDKNDERLDWVRTDRNGLVTIKFGGAQPKIRVSRGSISDPEPKVSDSSDADDMFEGFVEDVMADGAGARNGAGASREVRAMVPAGATRVQLTFDLSPAATETQAGSADGAGFDPTVAVQAEAATADFSLTADSVLRIGPPRSALVEQFNRARANGWIEFFVEAARTFNWPVALLMAIASRETNIRNILGDGGHGHGIMQIDDRSFPRFTSSGEWRVPRLNIRMGGQVLSGKRSFLSSRSGLTGDALVRASVAAYNGGEGAVLQAVRRGASVDSVTTQRNYSADVLERASVFRELLG